MIGCRPSRAAATAIRAVAAVLGLVSGLVLEASAVMRSLPGFYRAGEPVDVLLAARPDGGVEAYGVEEQLPPGWNAEAISHDGVLDPASGRVRWGPFFDGAARDLTFRIVVPAGSVGTRSFSGAGQFGGVRVPTSGPDAITSTPSAITGTLPAEVVPGTAFDVFLAAAPAEGVTAYSVSDTVPVAWSVSQVSHGGVFDTAAGSVKWGPFADGNPRTLQYRVEVPAAAAGDFAFSGRGVFDQTGVEVRGERTVRARDHRLRRTVAADFLPGVPFDVALRVEPLPATTVFSVEEQLPAGWTPVSVSATGAFDPATGRIKWGPFQGATPTDLTYRVAPPPGASGEARFSGIGVFDSRRITATGPDRVAAVRSSVVRSLPPRFQPGSHLTVSLLVSPLPLSSVWAVEEAVPTGWSVDQITAGGVFDAARGRVKWREFDVAGSRILSYRLLPPSGAVGEFRFDGLGVFDLETVATEGPAVTTSGSRVGREVATGFRPGSPLVLVLNVDPVAGTVAQSVEEAVPAGWTLENVDQGGVLDPVLGRVKWGPFTDGLPRRLTLTLRAPVSGPATVGLSGLGSFNGIAVVTGGPSELVRVDNRAPVAFDDEVERPPGTGVRTRVETLLANDADADSPGLTVVLPDPSTERGGTVRIEDGWVVYEPPSGGDPVEDSYLYFADDGQGGRDLARVTVRVGSGPGEPATLLTPEWDGSAWVVRFTGTPGASYEIQSIPFLGDPSGWTPLATVVVGPAGRGEYRDATAPTGFRLYRAVQRGGSPGGEPATLLTPEWDGSAWIVRFIGTPGGSYRIESAPVLAGPSGWTPLATVVVGPDGQGMYRDTSPAAAFRLYRAVGLGGGTAPAPTLRLPERDGAAWVIRFEGLAGRTYRVQGADSLGSPVEWTPLGTVVAGDGGVGTFRDTSPPPGVRLYRLELLP